MVLLVGVMLFNIFFHSVAPAEAGGSNNWTANGVIIGSPSITDGVINNQTLGSFKNTNPTSKPLAQLSGGDYVFAWFDETAAEVRAQRVNSSGAAQWGTGGVLVETVTGGASRYIEALVPDASGNVIIVYQINGSESIYAQKLDSSGATQWTSGGLPVANTASVLEATPVAVTDGQGGVIVAYRRNASGSYDIYGQRLNSSGAKQWTGGGLAVSSASNNQFDPTIVTSGTSSAIIGWTDLRGGSTNDVYAQKVSSAGVNQWTANGTAISTATGNQTIESAVADGSDGAVFSWRDDRSGAQGVYAQKINSSGTVQWTANGVAAYTGTFGTFGSRVTMSSTNTMIAYTRVDTDNDLYVQKLNASGTKMFGSLKIASSGDTEMATNAIQAGDGTTDILVSWVGGSSGKSVTVQRVTTGGDVVWTSGGVTAVAGTAVNSTNPATNPYGITNSSGDLILVGERTSFDVNDVFVQRLRASDGAPQWNGTTGLYLPNGISGTADATDPHMAADGLGNYIYAWADKRTSANNKDVYAQKVNAQGVPQWTSNGVAVATGTNNQLDTRVVADGAGGAIVFWQDATADEFRVQRLDADGSVHSGWPVGGVAFGISSVGAIEDVASDGAGGILVNYLDESGDGKVMVNRITASGSLPWGVGGVSASDPSNPCGITQRTVIASDGANGAYVAWNIKDSGTCLTNALYLTRLSGTDGSVVSGWTAYGNLMTSEATAVQANLAPDGLGGVVASWTINVGPNAQDIRAQRFTSSGTKLWSVNGVTITNVTSNQYNSIIASDGWGGAVIGWTDDSGGGSNFYAQKVNSSGVAQWTTNGVGNGSSTANVRPNFVADGLGGAIAVWEGYASDYGMFAQRWDSTGAVKWGASGITVSDIASYQEQFSTSNSEDMDQIASDGNGGVVAVFEHGTDINYTNPSEIRTQRIADTDGVTVTAPNGGGTLTAGASTNITWTVGATVDHFSIQLSTDGGASFPTTVISSVPASPYAWTVPNSPTTSARIRVLAHSASNTAILADVSDANFTIAASGGGGGGSGGPAQAAVPAVTLTQPNTAISASAGGIISVIWSYQGQGISGMRLGLSTDGGATYTTFASNTPPTAVPYQWTVPNATTDRAKLRVEAIDGTGKTLASDSSDVFFAIRGSATSTAPTTSATSTSQTQSATTTPATEPGAPGLEILLRGSVNSGPASSMSEIVPIAGDTVMIILVVRNTGDAALNDVQARINVPAGTFYVSPSMADGGTLFSDAAGDDAATYEPKDRIARFTVGKITPKGEVMLSISVDVLEAARSLKVDVAASADGVTEKSSSAEIAVTTVEEPTPPVPPTKTTVPPEPEEEAPQVPAPVFEQVIPPAEPPAPGGSSVGPTDEGQDVIPTETQPPSPPSSEPQASSGGESVTGTVTEETSSGFTAVAEAAQSVASFFARSSEALKETPVIDAVGRFAEALPAPIAAIAGPVVDAARDAVVEVRTNQAIQTANTAVVTPAAVATVAVSTANAIGGIAGFQQYGIFLFTQATLLFSRRKRQSFGTVYNWTTKIPVDLAIVRLIDAKTGRVAATRVTDKLGRYLFIAPPGAFKIEVRANGFSFPSDAIVRSETDGAMIDLYYGDAIEMPTGGVVSKNIPIDPIGDARPNEKIVSDGAKKRLQLSVAAIGPGLALVSYLTTPDVRQILAILLHLALFAVFSRLAAPKAPKSWGTVKGQDGRPLKNVIVRIVETSYNKVLESQLTDAQGRYSFLVGGNSYYLRFEKPGFAPITSQPLDFRNAQEPSVVAVDISLQSAAIPPVTLEAPPVA